MPEDVSSKVHKYFSEFPKRSCPKGQILVFTDESPEHIFYLTKGRVRQYDISYRGDELIVNIFKPPAFFPMSWAINKTPNKYFYKTETETELHIVPAQDALDFLQSNSDVTLELLGRVYRGMDGLLGRVVHLMTAAAHERLVYELVIESERFGIKTAKDTYKLDINESDLAARSGLSRETVSRELQKLKDSGLVSLEGKTLVVHELKKLKQP